MCIASPLISKWPRFPQADYFIMPDEPDAFMYKPKEFPDEEPQTQ